ncbi:alpha/beta hydrolase [Marinococcus halophilus]|uniref:alpha/beta hydrolase n=1 Tax=Marinococcus halophilus TaxID=1371 RepID=UPI0009A7FE06|nr:alpha/beta fold hydrolase [Marinococcus halophilus]
MKKHALFIHSAGPQGPDQGSSGLSFYLQKELSKDVHFFHPSMPAPENPQYVLWKKQISLALPRLSGEVLLIGHSLGGSALLKYLSEESLSCTVSGLFIIASPFWGRSPEWQLENFTLHADFEKALPALPYIFLYHSFRDNVVPFSHHQAYARKLPQSIQRILPGEDHLFSKGLPILMKDVRSLQL